MNGKTIFKPSLKDSKYFLLIVQDCTSGLCRLLFENNHFSFFVTYIGFFKFIRYTYLTMYLNSGKVISIISIINYAFSPIVRHRFDLWKRGLMWTDISPPPFFIFDEHIAIALHGILHCNPGGSTLSFVLHLKSVHLFGVKFLGPWFVVQNQNISCSRFPFSNYTPLSKSFKSLFYYRTWISILVTKFCEEDCIFKQCKSCKPS